MQEKTEDVNSTVTRLQDRRTTLSSKYHSTEDDMG